MITIGCAGFAVPASRYFKEFLFVEVQETHVALPGTGTIRRWRREAGPAFAFSVLAPRDIGQEAFRPGKIVETAVRNLCEVASELDARTAVFTSPPEFTASRANRASLKEFLASMRRNFDRVVWEPPPGWDADDAERLASEAGASAARDPLASGCTRAAFAYYRLPGPAGHKSRYEDPAIERLGELVSGSGQADAVYVFSNVDMFTDAKRLKKVLGMV